MSRPGQGDGPSTEQSQTQESARDGRGSRVERSRALVAWRESVVAGVGAWLVGLAVTAVPLWLLDLADDLAVSTLDLAVLVSIESVGGTVNEGELAATLSAYGALDSDLFGIGPAVHMLVPAVLLLVAGHRLAARHVETGATRRPLETVLAGGSLAMWFTAAAVLSTAIVADERVSLHVAEVLVVTLLYSGVFASVGAAVRSRAPLTSWRGTLAGALTFAVVILVWVVGEDPLADRAAGGLADLGGALEYFDLLTDLLVNHGIEEGEILPAWFLVVVPLVSGATLAYAARRRDPVVGAGEAARLGPTYGALVAVVVVGHVVALAAEFQQQTGDWDAGQTLFVNELVAAAPRTILLTGVVYPVAFAAVGGVVGALVYRTGYGRRAATRHG